MANAAAKQTDAGIEYSILTVEKGGATGLGGMTNDMQKALTAAEKMLETGKYEKVEVRQKYFDKKTDRLVDMSLKTLVYKKKSGILPIIGLLVFAVLAGAGAFAGVYFLTREAPPAAEEAAAEHPAAAPAAH